MTKKLTGPEKGGNVTKKLTGTERWKCDEETD